MNYKDSIQVLALLFFSVNAYASIGNIGFDSSSFFYKSEQRGTSSTTFTAKIAGQADQDNFHEQGDLQFFSFVDNSPSLNFESTQAYISTQKGTLGNAELTFGRRIYEWSKVDQSWNMMSLWSPRFTWDPINPQTIGMTGFFYNYQNSHFQFLAFGSPVAIPERGTPIEEKNGTITSPNPYFPTLKTELPVMGVPTHVNYTLMTPSTESILFRPNVALRGKYKWDSGMWTSLNAAILPVHTTQLAAEPYLNTVTGDLQVNIRPQFPMRNIYTGEVGYDAPDGDWGAWLSGSHEQPFNYQNNDHWLNPIITPATIVSTGADMKVTSNFTFHGAVLFIHEEPFTHSSTLPDVNVQLPSRFPLKQGFQVGGDWRFSDYTKSGVRWIQDLLEQNHFISLDISHRFPRSDVEIGGGGDAIFAQSTQGWVGQYYGFDRIRGWLRYAF